MTGKQVLAALNTFRSGSADHSPVLPSDVARLLKAFGNVVLLGETEKYRKTLSMCRRDNDVLCNWQTTGEQPESGDSDPLLNEGFECYAKLGFLSCPKKLMKRRIPDVFETKLEDEAGSERRKIKELRERFLASLTDSFGPDFHTERGLIRTLRRRGYAIAATITYRD